MGLVLAALVFPHAAALAQTEDTTPPPTSATSSSLPGSTSTSSPASSSTSTSAPASTSTTGAPSTTSTPPTTSRPRPSTPAPAADDNSPSTTQAPGTAAVEDPKVLTDLKAGSDNLTPDELDLLQRFLDTQGEVDSLSNDLLRLTDELGQAQEDLRNAVNRVVSQETQLRRTNTDLTNAERQLDDAQRRLTDEAVIAYIGGGRGTSSATAIMRARTVDDLSQARVYAGAVAEDQKNLIAHYADLRRRVNDLRQRASDDKKAATEARDALVDKQNDLEQQRQAKLKAQDDKQAAAADQASLLAEVESRRGDFLARLNSQRHSSDSVEGLLSTAQQGQTLPTITEGIFTNPVPGARLTQRYGSSVNPLYGSSGFHPGIDLAISSGTPIRAPADGKVVLAEAYGGYGNFTILDHGNGIGTCYGHQTAFAVQEGEFVTKGQVIGYVGSTGYSTGPHLHWEVRIFGQTDDPFHYLVPG